MDNSNINIEKVLEMQFTKVGKLFFQIDMMTSQIAGLTKENERLQTMVEELTKEAE